MSPRVSRSADVHGDPFIPRSQSASCPIRNRLTLEFLKCSTTLTTARTSIMQSSMAAKRCMTFGQRGSRTRLHESFRQGINVLLSAALELTKSPFRVTNSRSRASFQILLAASRMSGFLKVSWKIKKFCRDLKPSAECPTRASLTSVATSTNGRWYETSNPEFQRTAFGSR